MPVRLSRFLPPLRFFFSPILPLVIGFAMSSYLHDRLVSFLLSFFHLNFCLLVRYWALGEEMRDTKKLHGLQLILPQSLSPLHHFPSIHTRTFSFPLFSLAFLFYSPIFLEDLLILPPFQRVPDRCATVVRIINHEHADCFLRHSATRPASSSRGFGVCARACKPSPRSFRRT